MDGMGAVGDPLVWITLLYENTNQLKSNIRIVSPEIDSISSTSWISSTRWAQKTSYKWGEITSYNK